MPLTSPFSIVAVLALGLLAGTGSIGVATPAAAQSAALTKEQAAAVAVYDKALRDFKAVLAERRAQIDGKQSAARQAGAGALPGARCR